MPDEKKPLLQIECAEGKYEVIQRADGSIKVRRYGSNWIERVIHYPNLVLALAYDLEAARQEIADLKQAEKDRVRLMKPAEEE